MTDFHSKLERGGHRLLLGRQAGMIWGKTVWLESSVCVDTLGLEEQGVSQKLWFFMTSLQSMKEGHVISVVPREI